MIRVVVDGSCRQGMPKHAERPARDYSCGAWAAVIDSGDGTDRRVVSGYSTGTTNTEMELIAAIEGLAALTQAERYAGSPLVLYTDFQETANLHMLWREGSLAPPEDLRARRPLWSDLVEQFARVEPRVVLVGKRSPGQEQALIKHAHVACRARLRGDDPEDRYRLRPGLRGRARVSLSVRSPG